MKNIFCSFFIFALALPAVASACDSQYAMTSASGRAVIDCRVTGAQAEQIYNSMSAPEESFKDADGGPGGFRKSDDMNSCYASVHRTTYQCSQILDAQTGEVLSRSNQ